MTADEARRVEGIMRALGIPGVVAPADPDDPSGEWRVFDAADSATRRDLTDEVLAAVAARFPADSTEPAAGTAGRARTGPMRGFVFPPKKA